MTTSTKDLANGLSSSDGDCGKENECSKNSARDEDAVGAPPPAQDTENKKPTNIALKNHTADPQKLSPLSASSKINVALDAEQAPAAVPLSEDSKLRAASSLEIAPKKRTFAKTDSLRPVSISPHPVMQVATVQSRATGRRKASAPRGNRKKSGVLAEMPYISQASAVKKACSLKIVTSEEILTFPEVLDAMMCSAVANNSVALQWTQDGQAFTIDFAQKDEVKTLMKTFVGHANISAFTRELNMYGWERNRKGEKSTFTNPHFRRDRTRDLSPIQRRCAPVGRPPNKNKQSPKSVSSTDLTPPPRIRIILPKTSNYSSAECKRRRDSSSSHLPGSVVNTTLLNRQKLVSKRKGSGSASLPDSVVNTTLLKRQKTASKRKSNKVKESARRVSVYPELPAFKGPVTSTGTPAQEIAQSPSFDDLNAAALSVYNSGSLPTHLSHDLFVGDLDDSVFDSERHVDDDTDDRQDSLGDTTVASELLFFDQALQHNYLRMQTLGNGSNYNSSWPGISQRPSAEDFAQLLVDESTASLSSSEHQPLLSTASFLQRERHIAQEMDILEIATPPCGKIKMTLHGSEEKAYQISPVDPSAGEEEFFFPDEAFFFFSDDNDSPMMEIGEEKSFSLLQSPVESAAVRFRRESLSMAATASETSSKALATAMPTQAFGVSVVQNYQHSTCQVGNGQLLPFYQSPPRFQPRQQQHEACSTNQYQGNPQPNLPFASSWSAVQSFQDTFVSPPGRFGSTPFPVCPTMLTSVAPDKVPVNPPMPAVYPAAALAEASTAHSGQNQS